MGRDGPRTVARAPALDCNQNGVLDECDLASGAATDDGANGIPDECEGGRFRRGDVNVDSRFNITDAISLLNFLFAGGSRPTCEDAADFQDSGTLNISDAIGSCSSGSGRKASPSGPAGRMRLRTV